MTELVKVYDSSPYGETRLSSNLSARKHFAPLYFSPPPFKHNQSSTPNWLSSVGAKDHIAENSVHCLRAESKQSLIT